MIENKQIKINYRFHSLEMQCKGSLDVTVLLRISTVHWLAIATNFNQTTGNKTLAFQTQGYLFNI